MIGHMGSGRGRWVSTWQEGPVYIRSASCEGLGQGNTDSHLTRELGGDSARCANTCNLIYLRFPPDEIACRKRIYSPPSVPPSPFRMISSSSMLAPPPPTVAAGTWPRLARRGLKRPRGLWKARRRVDPSTTPSSSGCAPHSGSPVPRTTTTTTIRARSHSSWRGSDTDREEEGSKERTDDDGEVDEDEDDEMTSEHSGSSKRQRRESPDSCGSTNDVEIWAFFVEAAEAAPSSTTTLTTTPVIPYAPSPQLEMEDRRDSLVLIQDMVTTSIAERVNRARRNEESYEYSEWESVKGTLKRASELYDGAL